MSTQSEAVKPASASVPFSYAQAARGASTSASTQSSKPTSGAITPAREQGSAAMLKSELNGARWSDSLDDETREPSTSSASTAVDSSSITSAKSTVASSQGAINGTGSPASLDLANSSTSTLVRDEAPAARPDAPSSVWDAKVAATQAARNESGRSRGSTDRASSKGRKKGGKRSEKKDKTESEAAPAKPVWVEPVKYVDAPAPTVNPWLARAQTSKPAAVPKPSTTSTSSPAATVPVTLEATTAVSQKPAAAEPVDVPVPVIKAEKETTETAPKRSQPSEETAQATTSAPKATSTTTQSQPPKPSVDAVAWPTPETAQVDEQKKKSQDKPEVEAHITSEVKGKQAWNKLDFTPSVLFSTPLPGSGNPRRGGRGGARGGKSEGANGSAGDRRGDSNNASHTGTRRERSDAARSTSPGRGKRVSNDDGAARRPSRQETSSQEPAAKQSEEVKNKASDVAEQTQQKPSSAPRTRPSRNQEPMVNGEKHGLGHSNEKDNAAPAASKSVATEQPSATPVSTTGDVRKTDVSPPHNERKAPVAGDLPSRNHERKGSGSYSSFSGRGRGDRSRGGHRGARNNGHAFQPTAHSFVNNQAQFNMQGFNGSQKSPSTFTPDSYFNPGAINGQRYGNRSYTTRAASIPLEGSYRYPNGYSAQGLQVNTGVQGNGMYPPEYYNMPATAVPYQNDPASTLLGAVTQQMEYYFSIDNLLKDTFLRKHMDSQGFVLLTFIADFKRLKSMTHDLELIKYVCQQSPTIEHRIGPDGVDRLRAAKGWEQWVLPKEDRDATAQHDGPESLHQPPRPHPQFPDQPHMMRHSSLPVPQSAGPVLNGQGFQSLNSFAAPYNFNHQMNPSADATLPNHFQASPTTNGPTQSMNQPSATPFAQSSAHAQFFGNGVEETEPDSFTDAEVEALKVVVRDIPGEPSGSSRAASSRTFSNGSAEAASGPVLSTQSPPPESAVNDTDKPMSPVSSDRVNRFLSGGSSRLASPRNASRNGESPASGSNGVYYIKDKDLPSYQSPTDTTSELYLHARDRALQSRTLRPCPHEMIVMYNFWEHFLVRNFNSRMYMEFRTFAMEDASTRNEFKGLNSLLKYYGKAIAFQDAPIRRSVAQDYVNLVRSEPRESDRPAFKQLRAAWRDGALNMKNRKRVKDFLDAGLEEELDR